MNNSTNTTVLLSLLFQPQIFTGFINAYRQPVGFAKLRVASYHPEQLQSLQQALEYYFARILPDIRVIKSTEDILLALGEIVSALQKTAGLPIFDAIKLVKKNTEYLLWIPTLYGDCYHQVMSFTLELMNYHAAQGQFVAQPGFSERITLVINHLKTYAPLGSNSLRLLAAAHENNIPWMHVSQNIFQYGYGGQSRWLDSTFTDNTSQLGTKLARSKIGTLSLLRKAGLPVPEQYVVKSADEAVAKAKSIGYPVVIKPYDQDGGKGVFAQLMSEHRLRKAYDQAKLFSDIVILEKHVFGKDYRLLVLNGKLIWAIERIPPQIIGDGISDISTLIKMANEASERSHEEHATLKYLKITPDMMDYLQEQGLGLNSIPVPGQMVPLNPVANISTGGIPVGVMDKVHPDNKRLIETAASLLRLDIAGIDFIISDIQQSYLEADGRIIEINSQPQLGTITAPHIYQQVLSTLLLKQGRIPIIVIWGGAGHDDFISNLMQSLSSHYEYIGLARNNIATLNADDIIHAPSLFAAANSLLFNKQVELLIYCVNQRDELASQGLPFDRYDYLFMLESPAAESDDGLIDTLFKACLNQIIILENTLKYFMSLGNSAEYPKTLALNTRPAHLADYPDFINTISYLDAQDQLIMQSIAPVASVSFETNCHSKLTSLILLSL